MVRERVNNFDNAGGGPQVGGWVANFDIFARKSLTGILKENAELGDCGCDKRPGSLLASHVSRRLALVLISSL